MIITYSNYFEFNGRLLAFRKKLLFDITNEPTAIYTSSYKDYFGYWINRKWIYEGQIKNLIINKEYNKDVSNLPIYIQELLDKVY